MKTRICLVWLLAAGCGGQEADPFAGQAGDSSGDSSGDVGPSTTGGPETGGPETGTDTKPGGADDDDDDSSDGDTEPVKLDVGMPDLPGPRGDGCEKVDFLFVIDNSGSMINDQERLVANFPSFIEAIQDTVDVEDYHVMVVDTDDLDAPSDCNTDYCPQGSWLNHCGADWECGSVPPHLDDACESVLGAGVVHPLGLEATQAQCQFAEGRRYMTGAEPDLTAAFECAALVGISGDGWQEQQMGAMVGAVDELNNAAGGCNEGFLRDDAILVVTVITDEDEVPSTGSGDPADWYEALIAAKGGNEDAVAMLGLVFGPPQYGWPARIGELIDLFGPYGTKISLSQEDWGPAFVDTVQLIDQVCDGFTPEG